jgi:hypothetical protein
MKFISIAFICIFFGLFGREPFEINEFTSQQWYGGVAGAGKGINYSAELVIRKNPGKIKIEGVIVDDYYFPDFKLTGKRNPLKHFAPGVQQKLFKNLNKKDTLLLRFEKKWKADRTGNLIPPPPSEKQIPEKYRGKNVLIYRFKGKMGYQLLGKPHKQDTKNYQ